MNEWEMKKIALDYSDDSDMVCSVLAKWINIDYDAPFQFEN